MLTEEMLITGIVAGLVACAGLWWFRLMLPVVRKQSKTTRYGVYALIWLAYFILTTIAIGMNLGKT